MTRPRPCPPPYPAPSSQSRDDTLRVLVEVMAVQFPEEALAIAGCIVAWSLICLASSVFLVHLVWVHNEKRSCRSLGSFLA